MARFSRQPSRPHVRFWHLTDLKAGTDDVCLGVQTGPRDTIALDVLLTQSRRRGLGTARPELYAQQRHGIIQRMHSGYLGGNRECPDRLWNH